MFSKDVFQRSNWHRATIEPGRERIDKHYSHDEYEQELKDAPDEVMCVVRSFEDDRIDASLFPNYERTPEEGCGEVCER